MDSIRFGDFFKSSWENGTAAIVSRPLISLIVFALLFSTSLWSIESTEMVRAAQLASKHVDARNPFAQFGATIGLLLGFVMLSVQVMRHATLGEGSSGRISYLRGVWRNGWLTAMFGFASIVIVGLAFVIAYFVLGTTALMQGRGSLLIVLGALIFVVCVTVCTIVMVRLEIMYCSRAVGERLSMSEAWQLTKGRFWTIFFLHLLVHIPIYALMVLHFLSTRLLITLMSHANLLLEEAAVNAVLVMLGTAVWSACVALLYRAFVQYGKRPPQEVAY